MGRYNTNLAAEFHVLSVLHRLGLDAYLTLGNKKAIDIVVGDPAGRVVTVDVKGVAGSDPWPADNIKKLDVPRHFWIFWCIRPVISKLFGRGFRAKSATLSLRGVVGWSTFPDGVFASQVAAGFAHAVAFEIQAVRVVNEPV